MKFARVVGATVLMLLAACGDEGAKAPIIGDSIRPFVARTLAGGEEIRLPEATAGKVVVVRFWATWCAFCKDEMKTIEPLWQQERERGLLVLAVNAGQKPEDIRDFVAELGVTYPVLLDPGAKVARAYGVTGLPMTFIVDRDGHVRHRILGESDMGAFRKMVEELL